MTVYAASPRAVERSSPLERQATYGTREALVLCGLVAGLAIAFVLSLALGSTHVPIGRVVEVLVDLCGGTSTERDGAAVVVEAIRLPRSLTALLAGAALGIAGLQMQTLFRNPLADPFALGISSGASLGVAIVVLGSGMSVAAAFGASTGLRGDALLIGAALAGALAVLALVLVVSSRVANPTTVLVLGLMFGYAASALVTVLVGVSSPERLMQLAQWGFGQRVILKHVGRGIAIALLVLLTGTTGRSQPHAIPARIVSTSPSITETLFAVGLGDRVVGVSIYCRYPAAVAALPKVGTFLKPDAETIARLKPDLVFVHTGPNNVLTQLGTLGIKTAVVDRGSLPGVFAAIREIGSAAHVADRGERLVGELEAGLDRVKASVAGRPPRKILIVVGRRTGTLTDIIAVGPGSYLHDIAAIAGGTNVLASSKLEYPRISMETVISLAPDVIVDVGEMGESPADSDRRRQITEGLWRGQSLVKAVRDGGVHAVHDEAFVVPGPRIVEVARRMARWLHGVEP